MPTRYLLIDDEPGFLDQVRQHFADSIEVDYCEPKPLEPLMAEIRSWLGKYAQHSLGILLDWRLREGAAANAGHQIPRAATIAQEFRSEIADTGLMPVPVIVISSLERIAPSWNADSTAHDLFDTQILKDNLGEEGYRKEAAAKLVGFAEAYGDLRQRLGAQAGIKLKLLLQWPVHGTPKIEFDDRIQADFDEGDELTLSLTHDQPSTEVRAPRKRTVHEYTRFLVRELLDTPGPLIDENRLGAILGVNIDTSISTDWPQLLERDLNPGAYRGPLASVYPRWWLSWVEDWWKREIDEAGKSPRAYDAPERTARLIGRTRLTELKAAEPIVATYSRRYTTICEVFVRPLDPVDGIRLLTREPKPWQSTRFASEEAVRVRKHRGHWDIHPSDLARAKTVQSPDA